MKKEEKNNENRFFIKLTKKDGISLLTLVITIIVIIILAAAVVMSLNNNNVLTNASSARYTTDLDTMQSYLELTVQKAALRHQGTFELDIGEVTMDETSNVKESRGVVTWESTDIGNLSGKIIFDEGIDTDTEFYTGYKLPVYGSETRWYIDEHGKLVLKTGSRVYGADEIPNEAINARKVSNNPQKYYGAYVNYTPTNALTEKYKWRIFYATSSNIYLISSDYVSVADLPETSKGHKPVNATKTHPKAAAFENVINDYVGSMSIADDMKWFNQDYFNKNYTSDENNMKAVAYMLDKGIWTNKFGGTSVDYVVGGPSIEMVLNSYNQKTDMKDMYKTRAENFTGYKFSEDGGNNWLNYSSDKSKYLTKYDELYKINSESSAVAYWLSSASNYGANYLMNVYSNGYITIYGSNVCYAGFRPIICLKSNTKLKEIEDGEIYEI